MSLYLRICCYLNAVLFNISVLWRHVNFLGVYVIHIERIKLNVCSHAWFHYLPAIIITTRDIVRVVVRLLFKQNRQSPPDVLLLCVCFNF